MFTWRMGVAAHSLSQSAMTVMASSSLNSLRPGDHINNTFEFLNSAALKSLHLYMKYTYFNVWGKTIYVLKGNSPNTKTSYPYIEGYAFCNMLKF